MVKFLVLISILGIAGCCVDDKVVRETPDSVLLYNKDGMFKKSKVTMFGVYCTVAWYKSIDNIYLRRDGTAKDGVFFIYTWTLSEFGKEADKIWYDKTCKEIVN